jgi:beta-lactam-binding protein with PASTA domain
VTNATLTVRHYITNNPNDKLRPEDLENEAAEGRKPAYTIEGTIGEADEVWKSSKSCFEGDGDFIDTEEGAGDPDAIGVGTVFKNMPFAITSSPPISPIDLEPPYPFSSDLREALTNAWYTTVDRDPFEWSYDANPDPYIQDFVGSRAPNPLLGDLVSGPRWRLTANKYGQDLPGLEIAIDAPPGGGTDGADCYAPPFAKELIKYNVGEPIVTVINLLDWDESEGPSPLATTRGWVDIYSNDFVAVDHIAPDGTPISTNGVPMTDDFDLAVYVKGDRKATGVFDATLSVDWDAVSPVLVVVPDVVGLDQATAEADIVAVNLTVGTISTAFDDFVPAGDVISQAPLAGTSVAEFTPVDLLVSLGPDLGLINVPNVVGLDQATAEATIVAANLTVGTITPASSDTVPEGDVISQSPVDCIACATVGDPVDLVVSTGPDVGLIDVPNVVGLSQAAAEAAIVAANLTVGNVTTENSATVPAGDVISQSPTDCVACASVGDPVDLVVSLGPADLSDVSISSIFVPSSVPKSVNRKFDVYIINDINAAGDGTGFVRIIGMDGATEWVTVDLPFSNLQPSTVATLLSTTWTSPSTST